MHGMLHRRVDVHRSYAARNNEGRHIKALHNSAVHRTVYYLNKYCGEHRILEEVTIHEESKRRHRYHCLKKELKLRKSIKKQPLTHGSVIKVK